MVVNSSKISIILQSLASAIAISIGFALFVFTLFHGQPTAAQSPPSSDGEALDAEQLLELMRANDAQFDNVRVEYDFVYYSRSSLSDTGQRVTDNNAKIRPLPYRIETAPGVDTSGMPDPEVLFGLASKYMDFRKTEQDQTAIPVPEDERKWVDLLRTREIRIIMGSEPPQPKEREPMHFHCVLGLRWPDLAVERESSPGAGTADDLYSKWRSIGQDLETLTVGHIRPGDEAREWTHTKKKQPIPLNSYQELVLWMKFSLGIGYADYIVEITSMQRKEGRLLLEADMQIWPDRISKARLELDDTHLVRKAEIDANVTRIVIENSGEFSADGRFHCAKSGEFQRAFVSTGTTGSKFDIVLRDVQFNLSDEEFNRLADLSSPPGEHRYDVDHDNPGQHDNSEQVAQQVWSPVKGYSLRAWLVAINVLVVIAITLFLARRRIKTR